MNERDPELEGLFRAARREEEPTDEDRRAVRRALAARLATAAAAGAVVTVSTRAAAAASGGAALGKATLVGWFAAGLGAGAAVGAAVTVAVVTRSPDVPPAPARSVSAAPIHSAPRGAPPLGEPAGMPDAQAPAPSAAPLVREPTRPAPSAPPSLEVETRALGDVQRALREGRPDEALRLLAQQDASFARGSLKEERAAARVLALCAAGRVAEGRAARERFLASYPQSPAADRVRATCAP
jgi:hypothetical protein